MNVESVKEDEDFPVFKAGPPIPVRTKPSKTSGKHNSHKSKQVPLKATASPFTQKNDKGKDNRAQDPIFPSSSSVLNAESKVKKYIERVKASDELGRKRRVKPEQGLSLEDLYQVTNSRDQNIAKTNKIVYSEKGSKDDYNDKQSIDKIQEKLKETLRIVKEKDEQINKLRESCHDLAIKCADAENRVDEIRFSYGRLPSSRSSLCVGRREGSVCGGNNRVQSGEAQSNHLRRCASDECLRTCGEHENSTVAAGKIPVTKHDVETQIEGPIFPGANHAAGHWQASDEILQETCSNWMEKVQNWKTDSNLNLSQDSGGDRDSGFKGSAEIDTESVLRQQRHPSLSRSRRKCQTNEHHQHHHHDKKLLKVPSRLEHSASSNAASKLPLPQMSSSSTTTTTITGPERIIPVRSDERAITSTTTGNSEDKASKGRRHHQQHFWPSFSQSHFHLERLSEGYLPSNSIKAKSLFYELAEADRNKYFGYFQEGSNRHHHRLYGAKSLDVLYAPRQLTSSQYPNSDELRSLLDSSLEAPESVLKTHMNAQHRSLDQTVKLLDPLLDDATEIALRVRAKSERLAKMLQDACTFD